MGSIGNGRQDRVPNQHILQTYRAGLQSPGEHTQITLLVLYQHWNAANEVTNTGR